MTTHGRNTRMMASFTALVAAAALYGADSVRQPTNNNRNLTESTEPVCSVRAAEQLNIPNTCEAALTVSSEGDVGIGTSNPQHSLHIASPIGGEASGIRFEVPAIANVRLFPGTPSPKDSGFLTFGDGTGWRFHFGRASDQGASKFLTITDTGNVGIGVAQPTSPLHLGGPINVQSANATIQLSDSLSNMQMRMDGSGNMEFRNGARATQIHLRQNGNVGVGTDAPQAELDVIGTTRTQILQITGGADFAEMFDIAETDGQSVEPGMVVVLDSAKPGDLRLAATGYDSAVVGVVSGANGLKPGMVLRDEGNSLANGEYPVTLAGRAFVWVDASYGPVSVGDMLTTSPTIGHAMTATDPLKSFGSIIGKAMQPLAEGRGLVLVLVQPR